MNYNIKGTIAPYISAILAFASVIFIYVLVGRFTVLVEANYTEAKKFSVFDIDEEVGSNKYSRIYAPVK